MWNCAFCPLLFITPCKGVKLQASPTYHLHFILDMLCFSRKKLQDRLEQLKKKWSSMSWVWHLCCPKEMMSSIFRVSIINAWWPKELNALQTKTRIICRTFNKFKQKLNQFAYRHGCTANTLLRSLTIHSSTPAVKRIVKVPLWQFFV